MGHPHTAGEDCPNDDCNGEKTVTRSGGRSIYKANRYGCTSDDCNWSGRNMPTG
jgi:hypothetical protein